MMSTPATAYTRSRPVEGRNREQPCLTRDRFEVLLASLDVDRNKAGERYEQIRRKLLFYFERRNCDHPDRCADEVLDRAARKIHGGAVVPDVERYCYGIARVMILEGFAAQRRRQEAVEHLSSCRAAPDDPGEAEEDLDRLERALRMLSAFERELILAYYQGEGGGRINHRKALAGRYGLPANALRIRVHRIRVKLQCHFFSLAPSAEQQSRGGREPAPSAERNLSS